MTDDYVLNAGVYQHVGRNLACISALLLIVHVLGSDTDIGSLSCFHSRNNVNGRHTEYHIHILIRYQWL